MHHFSLNYIRCVRCSAKLDLEILIENHEINEGFLCCTKCELVYPIVSKIAIFWDSFSQYVQKRPKLGGELLLNSSHVKMKQFIKKSLAKSKPSDDYGLSEERWSKIYQDSKNSKFYSIVKSKLEKKKYSKILEHGCSIGTLSDVLSSQSDIAFGIDKSFYAIQKAKESQRSHLDFFVADSLQHPFGNEKFDLVIALNLLEIIEPKLLLKTITSQIKKGILVISDPYDFERGKNSVRLPLDQNTLRQYLKNANFSFVKNTYKPSFISWNLKINSRTKLQYKVDLLICQK